MVVRHAGDPQGLSGPGLAAGRRLPLAGRWGPHPAQPDQYRQAGGSDHPRLALVVHEVLDAGTGQGGRVPRPETAVGPRLPHRMAGPRLHGQIDAQEPPTVSGEDREGILAVLTDLYPRARSSQARILPGLSSPSGSAMRLKASCASSICFI